VSATSLVWVGIACLIGALLVALILLHAKRRKRKESRVN
jgi:ABC-type cobalamin transport system permease subunit